MTEAITVGRRLIPVEHIALVEPFDPAAQSRVQSDRRFQARIVLIDRESVLTEETPAAFAGTHGFRMLEEEGVCTNPAVRFAVETFELTEEFNPTKPYKSRLLWRDFDGNSQSKLLLTAPELVLSVVIRGELPEASRSGENSDTEPKRRRPARKRSRLNASSFRPVQ